ncbi:unnamed protein product [Rhodiola kirilowii]
MERRDHHFENIHQVSLTALQFQTDALRSFDRQMKAKGSATTLKLGLPSVLILCCFFFSIGFYASLLLLPQRSWIFESVEEKSSTEDHDYLPSGETGDDFLSAIPFQVLSWKPRIVYFPNFATAEQCRKIIEIARPSLTPSTLALRKGDTEANTKDIRTSSGMFISASEDKTGILDLIESKIARATMIPKTHGESFNILRYEIGQRYNSHYDAFNPAEYGPQKSQRVASFLLYLSDVEEGGETMFPFENGMIEDPNYDFQKCVGLRVKPRRGDGVLFYSVFPNGTIDETSLHGSCPVIRGKKWVATKWIRDQPQDD